MKPEAVRRRVLADHHELRADLDRIELLAREILEGLRIPVEALRMETERLFARLETHMKWEEAYLLPALRDADAWGAERAQRLVCDHKEQRELLGFIQGRLRDAMRPSLAVARDATHLITLLRDDMLEEEHDLLDPDVLRDDVVGISVETG